MYPIETLHQQIDKMKNSESDWAPKKPGLDVSDSKCNKKKNWPKKVEHLLLVVFVLFCYKTNQ